MKANYTNGEEIEFRETPYYYCVVIRNKIWYWHRDMGEFDGGSFKPSSLSSPTHEQILQLRGRQLA